MVPIVTIVKKSIFIMKENKSNTKDTHPFPKTANQIDLLCQTLC